MVQLGYALSSEEHTPNDLVRYAQRAEEVGFAFALISDHYHPWPRPAGAKSICVEYHLEKIQRLPKPGTTMSRSIRLARTKKAFSDFINRKSCQSFGRHYS